MTGDLFLKGKASRLFFYGYEGTVRVRVRVSVSATRKPPALYSFVLVAKAEIEQFFLLLLFFLFPLRKTFVTSGLSSGVSRCEFCGSVYLESPRAELLI